MIWEGDEMGVEEGEHQKDRADDQAADRRGEGIRAEALLYHAEGADRDGAHEQPRAGKGVRADGNVLELELAHQQRGRRLGAHVEAAGEDAVEREEREECGAHLDEEAADGHDDVKPLHEMDPLVARPVDRRVGRLRAVEGHQAAAEREHEEGREDELGLTRAVGVVLGDRDGVAEKVKVPFHHYAVEAAFFQRLRRGF